MSPSNKDYHNYARCVRNGGNKMKSEQFEPCYHGSRNAPPPRYPENNPDSWNNLEPDEQDESELCNVCDR